MIEDDLYTLSYAALADDGFIAPNGRELCRILNEDGRFGDFVYPEPQNGDGLLAMNLTEISRSAILKEFPNAENISYIQRQIVGVFNDGFILLYHYDLDGETRSCSVTLSIPSFMIDGKVTVTPGWPDDTSDLASESMIYDHYSAGYNENGDLILRDLDNGSEIVIDSCVADDSLSIQDYYVPRFWKFTENGRLLYHINGWESYIGLGCYNIKTGDNTIYQCHAPCAMKGNTIYAASAYDEGDFTLYRLILDDDEYAEQKINLPEELSLDGEMPCYVIIDEYHAAFVINDGEGQYRVVLVEIEGKRASVIRSVSFESKVASAQYPHVFGDYLIILCERHAMADEYAFAIPLALDK